MSAFDPKRTFYGRRRPAIERHDRMVKFRLKSILDTFFMAIYRLGFHLSSCHSLSLGQTTCRHGRRRSCRNNSMIYGAYGLRRFRADVEEEGEYQFGQAS